MIRWDGVKRVSGSDAGSGRKVWLSSNLPSGVSVVDLGGTGELLKEHDGRVVACDDLSGFGPGSPPIRVPFRYGDVQNVPFADDTFDVAVLAEVLEHVPQPERALREACRVAKRVLLTTPFEQGWQNGMAFRVSGHIRYATPDILAAQCRRAGVDAVLGMLVFGGWAFLVGVLADPARGLELTDVIPGEG